MEHKVSLALLSLFALAFVVLAAQGSGVALLVALLLVALLAVVA